VASRDSRRWLRPPYSGHVFIFRGKRGDLIQLLWWDGDGLCLFQKRLERGRFIWPQQRAVQSHSHERSYRCCWKGSIGVSRSERGNHKQQDKWIAFLSLIFR
jgi:transposase